MKNSIRKKIRTSFIPTLLNNYFKNFLNAFLKTHSKSGIKKKHGTPSNNLSKKIFIQKPTNQPLYTIKEII